MESSRTGGEILSSGHADCSRGVGKALFESLQRFGEIALEVGRGRAFLASMEDHHGQAVASSIEEIHQAMLMMPEDFSHHAADAVPDYFGAHATPWSKANLNRNVRAYVVS